MSQKIRFAINRICAPTMPLDTFAAMVQRLGVAAIEIRNDLTGIEPTHNSRRRLEITTPPGVEVVRVIPADVEILVPAKRTQ